MKALDLANYIVSKCIQDEYPISNLQLQKIMFFIQKDFLQNDLGPAFDERIEAWQFGPVVPIAYYKYRSFGGMPITIEDDNYNQIPAELKKQIDKIITEKRILPPWDLVDKTHKRDGAWDRIYQNGQGLYKTISIADIKLYG